jgi:hypothetical protein
MAAVKVGMTADEIRAILGEPASIQRPDELGIFHGADLVWTYQHHRRGKFVLNCPMMTYLQFRDSVLQGTARAQFKVESA